MSAHVGSLLPVMIFDGETEILSIRQSQSIVGGVVNIVKADGSLWDINSDIMVLPPGTVWTDR